MDVVIMCNNERDFFAWGAVPLDKVCGPSGKPSGEPFCDRKTDDS